MLLEEEIVSAVRMAITTLSATAWQDSDAQFLKDKAARLARFQLEGAAATDEETRADYRAAAQEDLDLLAAILCQRANDAGRQLSKELCQAALQAGLQALLTAVL